MRRSRQRKPLFLIHSLRMQDKPLFLLVVVTVVIAIVTGGAPLRPGPAVLLFWAAGLATLALALWRGAYRQLRGWLPRLFFIGICLLPFLQVVPLPYDVWTALPGHALARGTFEAAGLAGASAPWSVAPVETLLCCVMVFPLAGVFLAVLTFGNDEVDLLLLVVGVLVLVGLAVGVVQVATAGEALRIHAKADHRYLLGFFSNKNHSATLLAASMFVATYFVRRLVAAYTQRWIVSGTVIVLLLAAILATNSRAGLALGVIAALLCIGSMVSGATRHPRLIAAAVLVTATAGAALLSFSGIADRSVGRYGEIGQDRRWTIWTDTVPVMRDYLPFGAGMGTFVPVYRTAEALSSVNPRYANHAHNDYLEFALEGGVPAIALIVSFFWIWGHSSYWLIAMRPVAPAQAPDQGRYPSRRTSASPAIDRRRGQGLVGSGTTLLILLHSSMDYPLRTAAWSSLVAICLALMLRGSAGGDTQR